MKNIVPIIIISIFLYACGASENILPPTHQAPFLMEDIIQKDINFRAADHILVTDTQQLYDFLEVIRQEPTGKSFNLKSIIRTISIRDTALDRLPQVLEEFDHLSGLILEGCHKLNLNGIDDYFQEIYKKYKGKFNSKDIPAVYFLNSLTLRDVNADSSAFQEWPELNGLVYLTELVLDDIDNLDEYQIQYLMNHLEDFFPNLRYLALERLNLEDSMNLNIIETYEELFKSYSVNTKGDYYNEQKFKKWIDTKCNPITNKCPLDFSNTNLFALSLTKNELTKMPPIPTSMFSLDLSLNNIGKLDLDQIATLDSLQYFLLHCNKLPYLEMMQLAELPKEFLLTLSLECNIDNNPTIEDQDSLDLLPRDAERKAINSIYSSEVVKFINYGRRYESDFTEEPMDCSECWNWRYLPLLEGKWKEVWTKEDSARAKAIPIGSEPKEIEIIKEHTFEGEIFYLVDKGIKYEIEVNDLMLNQNTNFLNFINRRTIRGIVLKKGPYLDKSENRSYFQFDQLDVLEGLPKFEELLYNKGKYQRVDD